MATRRFNDGSVTVALDGALEKFVVDTVRAVSGAALDVMESAAEAQATESRLAWYSHVTRRTGKSGDIQAVTTISPNRITVSIGSTDKRVVEFKGIKRKKELAAKFNLPEPTSFPGKDTRVVSFIHEPGPLSMVMVAVDEETYWKTPAIMRGPTKALYIAENGEKAWKDLNEQNGRGFVARTEYMIRRPNPEASGGRKLLQLLVRGPTKRLALKLGPQIIEEIQKRVAHG